MGDTARWRLLNASINDHAMHLHGFFFEVTSLGNQDRDHAYSIDQVPHVVTQHLDPGETTSIVWTPDRPGRWLLHCHMAAHMAKQEALEQPIHIPLMPPITPMAWEEWFSSPSPASRLKPQPPARSASVTTVGEKPQPAFHLLVWAM
jgi:hypothetical protein